MNHVGDAVHHVFERDSDLLLDLFGGNAGPLGNDVYVVVGDVRIRFDGKLMKGNRSPDKQQKRRSHDQEAVLERKIDKLSKHLLLHRVPDASALRKVERLEKGRQIQTRPLVCSAMCKTCSLEVTNFEGRCTARVRNQERTDTK